MYSLARGELGYTINFKIQKESTCGAVVRLETLNLSFVPC